MTETDSHVIGQFNIGSCPECATPGFHHVRACSKYVPMLTITAPDGGVLAEFHADGETVFTGTPTEAATAFWDALSGLAAVAYQQGVMDATVAR